MVDFTGVHVMAGDGNGLALVLSGGGQGAGSDNKRIHRKILRNRKGFGSCQ
jgi:hypothetical protein